MRISQPIIDTHEIIGILQKEYNCSSQTAEAIIYTIRKFYLDNMENSATKEQLDFLKESLEKQLEGLATKEDLLVLATKIQQEMSKLATKTQQDISKLATKEDLASQIKPLKGIVYGVVIPLTVINIIALITVALYLASM